MLLDIYEYGNGDYPAMESFMWFSFVYISLLALHKTHII